MAIKGRGPAVSGTLIHVATVVVVVDVGHCTVLLFYMKDEGTDYTQCVCVFIIIIFDMYAWRRTYNVIMFINHQFYYIYGKGKLSNIIISAAI